MADGNGNVPLGASLQMALRMEKRFKELGGKIFYNKNVEKIVVEKKHARGIKLEDDTFAAADYVIPAVDTDVLFHKLLSEKYMPKEWKRAYQNPEAYPATSGFQVAFAVDRTHYYGETIFVEIEPMRVADRMFDRMYVKMYGYDDIFLQGNKMVIQTCITQTDEDFLFWEMLTQAEYEETKRKLVEEVTKRIEKAFPELGATLEFLDAWTPVTYERYCNAYHGSYMSFVTTPNGKQIKAKGQLKGIKNLYIAGQWTTSPGGLPVAVVSGKFAVQRLLKKQGRGIDF